MWALTYDYMVGYSMDDMSPVPALAKSWETSDDGLTWTFDIREGVKWSDGEPFTAADIAYTYNRVLTGDVEGALYGSYLTSVSPSTAPDDTTVVLKLTKPNAVLPLLPIPIIPEHIWKNVSEKEAATYPAEPSDGHARRRHRAVPAGRGQGRRLVRTASRRTRTTGAASRTSTRSSSGCSRPRTRWSRR